MAKPKASNKLPIINKTNTIKPAKVTKARKQPQNFQTSK